MRVSKRVLFRLNDANFSAFGLLIINTFLLVFCTQ